MADPDELSLEEIDQQLSNPLTSLWSLTFQENYSLLEGDLLDETEYANNFFFQPALPVPVGRNKILIARPVSPLLTQPVLDGDIEDGDNGHETGFGDIQVFTAVRPNRTDGNVWGAGATLILPTASSDIIGDGKYQVGPAFLFFHMGSKWTLGTLTQHWWLSLVMTIVPIPTGPTSSR